MLAVIRIINVAFLNWLFLMLVAWCVNGQHSAPSIVCNVD